MFKTNWCRTLLREGWQTGSRDRQIGNLAKVKAD
jgi:hypothetical protein